MLDAVVDYLPSPLEVPPVEGVDIDDPSKVLVRKASDEEPFAALVFKIMTDPYVGQLAFFRVYSGVLKSGRLGVQRGQGPQGTHRPAAAHARQQARRNSGNRAGDICAAVGLRTVSTGDTICDDGDPVVLESIDVPDAGDPACGGAQDQGRPGKAGHGDSEAGPGRSYLPREHGSRNRADDSVRDGRTAPGNHRGPHDARVRRGRERGQTPGGLPRDHPQEGRGGRAVRAADGRPRPVRPRKDPGGAAALRFGLRV